jgi:hypothetical protein
VNLTVMAAGALIAAHSAIGCSASSLREVVHISTGSQIESYILQESEAMPTG